MCRIEPAPPLFPLPWQVPIVWIIPVGMLALEFVLLYLVRRYVPHARRVAWLDYAVVAALAITAFLMIDSFTFGAALSSWSQRQFANVRIHDCGDALNHSVYSMSSTGLVHGAILFLSSFMFLVATSVILMLRPIVRASRQSRR